VPFSLLPEKSNFCNDSKPPREDGIVPAILYSGRLISITTLLLNDPVNETPVHVTKIELVGLPSTHTQPLCDAPISIAEASSHINVSSETMIKESHMRFQYIVIDQPVGDEVGLTVGAVVGWKVGAIENHIVLAGFVLIIRLCTVERQIRYNSRLLLE